MEVRQTSKRRCQNNQQLAQNCGIKCCSLGWVCILECPILFSEFQKPCPSFPWFFGFPWLISSKEFPCLFSYFLCIFRGLCGFGGERKSLVKLRFFLGKTEKSRNGRTGKSLISDLVVERSAGRCKTTLSLCDLLRATSFLSLFLCLFLGASLLQAFAILCTKYKVHVFPLLLRRNCWALLGFPQRSRWLQNSEAWEPPQF